MECERVRGNQVRFGAAVILIHESTQMVLTATKQVRNLPVLSKGLCTSC